MALETMKQGSEYNEKETEVLESSKRKIPKNVLIGVGAGIVALILIVVVSISVSKNHQKALDAEKEAAIEVEDTFKYTADERTALKSAGFSDSEIADMEKQAVSPQTALQKSQAAKQDAMRKLYVELRTAAYQAGSPEYKQLLDNTWLAEAPVTITKQPKFTISTVKENVDYERITAHGVQVFLKLTLGDNHVVFYSPSPDRYAELKDKGNIVINYTKILYGSNYFVTNITEVKP